MKNLLLGALLILSIGMFGQSNFPGEDTELLIGKELKVVKGSEKYGIEGFYTVENFDSKEFYSISKKRKIIYKVDGFNTKYSELIGRVFTVESVIPYTDIINNKRYKLKINNKDIGYLYYDYSPKYQHNFPFEVIGGLTPPDDFYCKYIETRNDKFTNEITYYSPIIDGVQFERIVNSSAKERFYLYLEVYGSTLNVGTKDIIILLENNKRIVKSANINPSSYDGVWQYTSLIILNAEDIKLLKENKITDFRLYIYDKTVKEGDKIQQFLNCVINKN